MPSSLNSALRRALKTAILDALAENPQDDAQLETLRASFTSVLENAVPLPGGGVTELAHRAALAAQLDDIFGEIQHGARH